MSHGTMKMSYTKMSNLSIIIPILDEEKNIRTLYFKLMEVIRGEFYEIIFIDDGSTDNSFQVMKNLQTNDKNIKIIKFRKRFGKSAALHAGFKHATGDIIITMDGDLQDDPAEIPKFLDKLNGYDMVVGWRDNRRDSISKTLPSGFFNYLTRVVTKVDIHDANCGFKACKKEVVDKLDVHGELHRYIPALAHVHGYRVGEVKVDHHERMHGRSKYGVERLIKGFMDLIVVKFLMTYSRKPSHLFGVMGLGSMLVGFVLGACSVYGKYFLQVEMGDKPLLVVLLVTMGVQLISLGLIGEIVTTNKEDYDIQEVVG